MTTTARPDTMSLMLLPSWRNGHRPNRVLGQRTHSMVRRRCSFHEFAGSVLVTEEGPAARRLVPGQPEMWPDTTTNDAGTKRQTQRCCVTAS
jgi:hypothetical protein